MPSECVVCVCVKVGFKKCWQISCNISKQQLACLCADLCCATGLSNHWEAAVAESGKTLQGTTQLLRDIQGRSHYFLLLLLNLPPPVALASGHWLVVHQDAPDRVTVELTHRQRE